MTRTNELVLYTDGGSRDNGGLAAIAWVVDNPAGLTISDGVEVIGDATNNQAEYRALISGLRACRQLRPTRVQCYSDSELMVKQLNGVYHVRDAELRPLYTSVRQLEAGVEVSYHHMRRNHPRIQQADRALRAARGDFPDAKDPSECVQESVPTSAGHPALGPGTAPHCAYDSTMPLVPRKRPAGPSFAPGGKHGRLPGISGGIKRRN